MLCPHEHTQRSFPLFFCGPSPLPFGGSTFFCGRRPLPFGGSHLRLPSGPAGIRTTTGSLSALARPHAIPTEPSGRLLPFGGSTVLETYSSTKSRSQPRTRGESIPQLAVHARSTTQLSSPVGAPIFMRHFSDGRSCGSPHGDIDHPDDTVRRAGQFSVSPCVPSDWNGG